MPDLRHLAVGLAVLLASVEAQASAELARSKNCVACHSPERRMIGPPFREIAARYADDASAVQTLSERVMEGTSGHWGQMPMPPQTNLTKEEAEELVRWILTFRQAGPPR